VALFEHAVEVTNENWLAHATLGAALLSDPDRWDDAERHLRESIRIRPTFATAHFNLGLLLSDRGRLQEANVEFYKSLELKPPCPEAHYFLALNARRLGDMETYQKHSQRAKDRPEPKTTPFDKAAECD
jgi:tetratricopeptide (TPR) repeat protein